MKRHDSISIDGRGIKQKLEVLTHVLLWDKLADWEALDCTICNKRLGTS